jgi:hypothetical protein
MRGPTRTPMRGRLERLGKRAKHAPSRCAGVVAMACTQGRRTQHGKPHRVVGRGDQPEAGDGQRGREGVAERPVVLRKPGNAGGGKGPWFKTGAESGEAREIGATLARINHQPPRSGLRGGRGGAIRAGGRLQWVRGGLISMGPQSMPAQRGSSVAFRSENGGCRTYRPAGVPQDAVGDGVMRRGARRAGAQAAVAAGGGERRLSRIAPNSSG